MFGLAFRQSQNAMALLDDRRRVLEVNGAFLKLLGYRREDVVGHPIYEFIVGGPLLSPQEWAAALAQTELTGDAELRCADGTTVVVHWGAHVETVTGRRLVLMVALSTQRWGGRFRRDPSPDAEPQAALRPRAGDRQARRTRQQRARDRRRAEHRPRHRAHPRAQRDGEGRSEVPRAPGGAGRWATVTSSADAANSATAVSTRARRRADHGVMPDHDPWPIDSPAAAARLAAVVDSIDMRDRRGVRATPDRPAARVLADASGPRTNEPRPHAPPTSCSGRWRRSASSRPTACDCASASRPRARARRWTLPGSCAPTGAHRVHVGPRPLGDAASHAPVGGRPQDAAHSPWTRRRSAAGRRDAGDRAPPPGSPLPRLETDARAARAQAASELVLHWPRGRLSGGAVTTSERRSSPSSTPPPRPTAV